MADESTGFFSKIRSNYSQKLANLSLRNSEHDGNSADDTLIHNAFVRYYDKRQLPYPEWLGVQQKVGSASSSAGVGVSGASSFSSSPYQPIRSHNLDPPARRPPLHEAQLEPTRTLSYSRPSRLTDMYNKSRNSSGPTHGHQQQRALVSNTTTISASRIRERMYSSSSASPTWGNGNR